MAKKDTHDVHVSPDGKYRWTEAEGLHRHDQAFPGAARDIPLAEAGGAPVPLPMVVLRCRCGDPDSHAQQGQHCPEAEIDVAESYSVSTTFNPGQ